MCYTDTSGFNSPESIMSKAKSIPADLRPRPRLFLVTPVQPAADFAALLERALAAADIACVLVWNGSEDHKAYLEQLKPLIPLIQKAGAAAILRLDSQLVARANADGFHADGEPETLIDIVEDLQPERIVGAANLRSKHDAMSAGEAQADYVFFGNLTPGEARGNTIEHLLERAEWWQAIFEIPCVVHAETLDAVGPLALAGADFVAVRDCIWSAEDPVMALKAADSAIDAAYEQIVAVATAKIPPKA